MAPPEQASVSASAREGPLQSHKVDSFTEKHLEAGGVQQFCHRPRRKTLNVLHSVEFRIAEGAVNEIRVEILRVRRGKQRNSLRMQQTPDLGQIAAQNVVGKMFQSFDTRHDAKTGIRKRRRHSPEYGSTTPRGIVSKPFIRSRYGGLGRIHPGAPYGETKVEQMRNQVARTAAEIEHIAGQATGQAQQVGDAASNHS
jgi:hypothetical protein